MLVVHCLFIWMHNPKVQASAIQADLLECVLDKYPAATCYLQVKWVQQYVAVICTYFH